MVLFQTQIQPLLVIASFAWNASFFLAMALASSATSSSSTPSPQSSEVPIGRPAETATCAVVGVGVLGTSLCRQLIEAGDMVVTGITKSSNRHEEIRTAVPSNSQGVFTLISSESGVSPVDGSMKYDNVVFCAPPSGFGDYAKAVQDAVDQLWNKDGNGVFLFTSSGAVYGAGGEDEEVIVVSESSPTGDAENSPRIDRLMRAEQAVLKAGGCCLRLAGLYNLSRGAHNFWLTQGKVAGSASGIINLLHYDDAASACLAAIRAGMRSKVFLLSDGNPLTRQEICAAALRARMYQGYSMPEFSLSGEEGRHGKVYETRVTSEQLHWSPKYASFQSYMESKS